MSNKHIIKFSPANSTSYVGNDWRGIVGGRLELVNDIEDAYVFGPESLEEIISYFGDMPDIDIIIAADMPDIDLLVSL